MRWAMKTHDSSLPSTHVQQPHAPILISYQGQGHTHTRVDVEKTMVSSSSQAVVGVTYVANNLRIDT